MKTIAREEESQRWHFWYTCLEGKVFWDSVSWEWWVYSYFWEQGSSLVPRRVLKYQVHYIVENTESPQCKLLSISFL